MDNTTRIDPVYSNADYRPPRPATPRWLYPRGEYEAFELARMRLNVKRLKLLVGYPGVFRPPVRTVWFRNADAAAPYEVSGQCLRGETDGGVVLKVTATDIREALPAIASEAPGWEASIDGREFLPAVPGGPPRGSVQPRVVLPLSKVPGGDGLYDVGREVLADLSFTTEAQPDFAVGESRREALLVDDTNREQSFATQRGGDGTWTTPLPLAFRYVKCNGATPPPEVRAAFTPLVYRREYDFGDPVLNRIWEAAAYTLRLCIMTFQIDGIKRDRLPWGGDLVVSLLANAFSFREADPIRRTLVVLARDGVQFSDVNGIMDYSLWCVISHRFFQDHFGGETGTRAFLAENWGAICQILDYYIARLAEGGGLLRPRPDRIVDGVEEKGDWCFIDWVKTDKTTALQMIIHWALGDGAHLAAALGDAAAAARFEKAAAALRRRIDEVALDAATGLYRGDAFNPASKPQRHANFLAVLSGVAAPSRHAAIADALVAGDMAECGTPYMISMELLALHRLGRDADALAKLRRVWGGMLDLGATTFFEGYEDGFDERTLCIFYDRDFGMSLCHAWSSAPCFLLPLLTDSKTG